MADVKISALPAAASVISTDVVPVVHGGVTDKATLAQILAIRPLAPQIVNADVDPAAAIAGTKVAPDFGSQTIQTTDAVWCGVSGTFKFGSGGVAAASGAGAAAIAYPNGSIWLRTDGTSTTGLYTRQGGAWFALGGSGFTAPTGTGLMKVTGGSMDVASSLLLNADVNAAAAIAGTKISPNFGSQAITTTGAANIGGTPAATGTLNLPNAAAIMARDVGNSADYCIAEISASNRLHIGSDAAFGSQPNIIWIFAGNTATLGVVTGNILDVTTNNIVAYKPIVGDGAASPYGVHGGVIITPPSNANVTLSAAQYQYDWIQLNQGSWATTHLLIFPAPASKAAGYYKNVYNNTATMGTLTVSTGSGTTRTVLVGDTARLWFDDTGVQNATGNVAI